MTETADNSIAASAGAPPPPPRPVTPRARRRAWAEGSVRLWWMSAIVIGLIASYLAVTQLADALANRRLIEQGHLVEATVVELDQTRSTMTRPMDRNFSREVVLQYTPPGGVEQEVRGRLDARPGETVQVGQTMKIRVDPANPRRWTDRSRAKAWLAEMTSVALLVPLVAALLVVALLRRAAILRVWREEPASEAVVVDTAHSAMAPRSRALRLTIKGDTRVFSTLYPLRAGVPAVGETLWVVAPPGKPQKAVVAGLYA